LAVSGPNDSDLRPRVFRVCEISWWVQTLTMVRQDCWFSAFACLR
jgi:hypothetical protein